MHGGRFIPAAALLCALIGAQSPMPRVERPPTPGPGAGPAPDPRRYAKESAAAVADALLLLKADRTEERRDACVRLGRLGGAAFPAIDALTGALADPDVEVENAAADALACVVRREDDDVIVRLVAAARADPAPGARGALKALAGMRLVRDDVAALMTELLEHQNPELRALACQGLLRSAGPAERSVRALGAILADQAEEPEVRVAAAETLRRFGGLAALAVNDVVHALTDPRAGSAAARLVADLGPDAALAGRAAALAYRGRADDLVSFDRELELARAIDATNAGRGVEFSFLRNALTHRDPVLRDEAAYRSGRTCRVSARLAPLLTDVLRRDAAPRVRARAAAALGFSGAPNPATLDALFVALRDPATRFDAAVALGQLAPDVEDTVGAFASGDGVTEEERAALYFASARLCPASPGARARLGDLLGSQDLFARGATVVFVGVLRDVPAGGDLALARALVDPVFEVRETARWAVARCRTSGAAVAAPEVKAALDAEGLLPYWLAATQWWSITPDDREMLDALCDLRHRVRFDAPRRRTDAAPPRDVEPEGESVRNALRDADPRVRERGARRAEEFGRGAGPFAPALERLLEDPSRRIRLAAARALAAAGVVRDGTESALAKLLEDPCWSVRAAAADALGALGVGASVAALTRAENDPVAAVRFAARRARVERDGPDDVGDDFRPMRK